MSYLNRPELAPAQSTHAMSEVPQALISERSKETLGKISEVETFIVKLASFGSSIHSAIDRLTEKIAPVLHAEDHPPVPALGPSDQHKPVPLVVDLQHVAEKLHAALHRLQSLEGRIDL